MTTTTPNMGMVLPTEGGSPGTWDTILDTALLLNDAHNHAPGNGALVPSAGLGINADVSWAGNAITAMRALGMTEVTPTSVAALVDALFVSSSDHNLYFRNASGTNVQITSGNTINVSVVGGIGGDYASVGALLSYVDADLDYLLQQEGSPRPWAGIRTGDIKLYQKAASINNAVTLKSPNSLSPAYTLTMPTALPSTQSLMQVNASGTLIPNNALAPNQSITLTGTGYYRRAQSIIRACPVNASMALTISGSNCTNSSTVPGAVGMTSSSVVWLPLYGPKAEECITSVQLHCSSLSGGTATFIAVIVDSTGATLSSTSPQNVASGATAVLNTGYASASGGLPWVAVTTNSGATLSNISLGCTSNIP